MNMVDLVQHKNRMHAWWMEGSRNTITSLLEEALQSLPFRVIRIQKGIWNRSC